jgi:uncharacterized lipoprotein YmbA
MIKYIVKLLICALVLPIAITGCSTTQRDRVYSLNSVANERQPGSMAFDRNVVVQVVEIPDAIDRSELVILTGPNQLEILDGEIWAEPIKSGIIRVLRQNLQASLPNALVSNDIVSDGKKLIRVQIWIDDMSVRADGDIRLNATWFVQGNDPDLPKNGTLSLKRNHKIGLDTQAIVSTWSDEFLALSQEIVKTNLGQ